MNLPMETDPQIPLPTEEAIESANEVFFAVQRVFPEAVTDFESKWIAFQEVCQLQMTSSRYSDISPLYCIY